MLTEEQYLTGRGLHKKISDLESKVEDKHEDILRLIAKCSNHRVSWWSWEYYAGHDPAPKFSWPNSLDDVIESYVVFQNTRGLDFQPEVLALIDDPFHNRVGLEELNLVDSYPFKWLFMPISEVEAVIRDGIEAYKRRAAGKAIKEKEKRKEKAELKKEKDALILKAREKLSEEERAALGIK